MKRLLLMDKQNYDDSWPEILRTAVRGIIFTGDKLLVIEDKFGEVKLPGGGQEKGEDDMQTLVREVREETGYPVIPESVRPFGYIEEKRRSFDEEKIWHQISRLYFCDIGGERTGESFTGNEQRLGMRFRTYTLDEAIEKNRKMLDIKGEQAWNRREYETLLLIKEHLEKDR